jgi:hypothetical protein
MQLSAQAFDLGLPAQTKQRLKPEFNCIAFGLQTSNTKRFTHQLVIDDDVCAPDVYLSKALYTSQHRFKPTCSAAGNLRSWRTRNVRLSR